MKCYHGKFAWQRCEECENAGYERQMPKPRYRWSAYLKCWLLIGSRFEHQDPPRILS